MTRVPNTILDQEEERRRRLLDAELGPVRDQVSPNDYAQLLERQKQYTDLTKVDQSLQWHEINRLAQEKGTEHAFEQANQLLGKEGKEYLNSLGPRTGPANKREYDAIINSPQYNTAQKKFNKQAGAKQGRDFEYVDKVAGFEDRPSTYAEGLASGIKRGLYPASGFDDKVFDDDVFRRRWMDSRRMDKWQLESHTKALKEQIDGFEQTRQKLTESYQRMDPFARTQYKEMEKKAKGLERARQEGRLRPLEYLRHMASLSDASKTIKWKHHMKAPGGEVGDIWDREGDGGFYQRQPDGTVKMVKMSPEYFQSKVQKLDEGLWLIPTIDKDGREVMKEVKGGRPGVDWKERQEYTSKLEKLEDEYLKQALSDDPDQDIEDARDWAQQMAIKRLGSYKDAADRFADPESPNPEADPEAFLQAKTEAERLAAYEQAQKDTKERAMKTFADRKVKRRQLAEAVAPVEKLTVDRYEKYKEYANAEAEAAHSQTMLMLERQHEQKLQQWMQSPQGPAPEPPKEPPKPKTRGPEKAHYKDYEDMFTEAEGDPELFGHLFHMYANERPALRYLLDNPIPLDRTKLAKAGGQKHLRDGYVYQHRDKTGAIVLALKHDGKFYPVRKSIQDESDIDVEAKGAARLFWESMTQPKEGAGIEKWGMF